MKKEHIQPPTCFVVELKSWILKDDKYDNGWLLNKAHTPQRRKWVQIAMFCFYYLVEANSFTKSTMETQH
jgi:hypothetical protein